MSNRLLLALSFIVIFSTVVFADSLDVSGGLEGTYSLSAVITPEIGGDIAVIWDLETAAHSKIEGAKPVQPGDYQIKEGRKTGLTLGLGYKQGYFTPWLAFSSQATKTTKTEMVKKDNNKTEVVVKDVTEPLKGAAFGVNMEYWHDRLGVLSTVARVPQGIYFSTRVKYRIGELGTIHAGLVRSKLLGARVMAGLGLAY